MAKPKVSLVKKGTAKKGTAPYKAGAALDFQIVDNGNANCSVFGVDAANNQVDISTVASITVSSSDTTKITVGTPTGMTFQLSAVGPLTVVGTPVVVTVTATWLDPTAGVGPFSFALSCDVVAGPVTGVIIVPGSVTVV